MCFNECHRPMNTCNKDVESNETNNITTHTNTYTEGNITTTTETKVTESCVNSITTETKTTIKHNSDDCTGKGKCNQKHRSKGRDFACLCVEMFDFRCINRSLDEIDIYLDKMFCCRNDCRRRY